MKLAILAGWFMAVLCAADPVPVRLHRTDGGIRFGTVGDLPSEPAPVIFVFAKDIHTALSDADFARVAWLLQRHSFLAVTLDLPCHGEDLRPGEPPRLDGWAARVRNGDPLVEDFTARVSAVADHLIRIKAANPDRIAAYGVSRGGFLALHVAAADPKFRTIAAFAPVTDLAKLSEFKGLEDNVLVRRLAAINLAGRLRERRIWIAIGSKDDRVGTDSAVALARALARSGEKDVTPDITLLVGPWPGHGILDVGVQRQAAEWIETTSRRR